MRRPWQLYALVALVAAAGIAAVLAPAITRDASFHAYADRRGWLGIPNAGDVLSNLPFVLVGITGVVGVVGFRGVPVSRRSPLAVALFVSLVGVGFGSGAYHAAPGDPTLALDWAPIVLTLAFLAALVVGDRIDRTAGLAAAVVLPVIALVSVAVWYAGGGTGTGTGTGTHAKGGWFALEISWAKLVVFRVVFFGLMAVDA
ncbi:MAG: hypothetical protein K8M05_39220, partial [Deltaproteobacteria bacterium]|nr:hypothetical protein [Kofleriaceae bacterium]